MRLLKCPALLCISFLFLLSFNVQAYGIEATRIFGADRYKTSAAICARGWSTSEYVVLACGEGFADALCGVPLAAKYHAPLLLTDCYGLDECVISEIVRINAAHAIIIGGPGVVSASVEGQLRAVGVHDIERIYGMDRYETSVKIAERMGGVAAAAVASGTDFADALSISSIAANLGFPVLLTQPDTLNIYAADYIKGAGIDRAYIIGGYGAVGSGIDSMLPCCVRLGGCDRYETNLIVLEEFDSCLSYGIVYMADGECFADALAASPLAALTCSPVLLVGDDKYDGATDLIEYKALSGSSVYILGGRGAVSEDIASGIQGRLSSISSEKNHKAYPNVVALRPLNSSSVEVMLASGIGNININSFTFTGGLDVAYARLPDDKPDTVILTTSLQEAGRLYGLYHNGRYTGKDFIGVPSVRLQPSGASFVKRPGERSEFVFQCEIENALVDVDRVYYVMEWTRDGLPAADGDMAVYYNGVDIPCRGGRYTITGPYKAADLQSHTIEIIFNIEGTYVLELYVQCQDI